MGLHRVPKFVDALDGRVAGGVEADGIIRAAHIIVNGCGNSDNRDAEPRQLQCAAEGTVTADRDNAVQPKHLAGHDRPFPALFGHKIVAAGGKQNRTASGQDMSHAVAFQSDKISIDQSLPASPDTDAFNPAGQGGANDRSHSGIHSGRVSAAGQHTDSFDTHACSSRFNILFYRDRWHIRSCDPHAMPFFEV